MNISSTFLILKLLGKSNELQSVISSSIPIGSFRIMQTNISSLVYQLIVLSNTKHVDNIFKSFHNKWFYLVNYRTNIQTHIVLCKTKYYFMKYLTYFNRALLRL